MGEAAIFFRFHRNARRQEPVEPASASVRVICRAEHFVHRKRTMPTEDCSVVLVDDDKSVRVALSRLFRSAGLGFIAFESAEEFLKSNSLESASCLIADAHADRGLSCSRSAAKPDRRCL
jgi:hypothetical protein